MCNIRMYLPRLKPLLEWGGGNLPIVLACFEGNGTRPSHMGIGINDGKVMYTLNSTEVHGVVYELPRENRTTDG